MFQKILVQVDPARPLQKAPELARRLARSWGAELTALYVVDEGVSSMMGGDIIRAMDSALGAVGEEALHDYEEALHDYEAEVGEELRFSKAIGYGDTAETIAKFVTKNSIDLVVTGGFHASVYTRIPFGSVVNEIVRRSPASVLLVRENHADPLRKGVMTFGFDGSPYAHKALHAAAHFAERATQSIDITHVHARGAGSRSKRLLAGLDEIVPKLKVPVERHSLRRPFIHTRAHAVLKHAAERKSPIIALSNKGSRSTFGGLSPMVERLVVHTDRPLLILHD